MRITRAWFLALLAAASAHADMALTGCVVDTLTERPIAGARVCLMGETRGVAQHAITTTDAAGAFEGQLTGALDNVRVGISAARYQPVLLAVTSPVVRACLLRARTYAVRGIVTDVSNTPVRNAQVALIADDEEWRDTCRAGDVWTDAAGTFEIAHVPVNAGPLALRVQAPGFVSAGGTALRVNPEDGDAFFTVRLNRGCRVVGQVTWDNGEKATNARVWVRAVKPEEVEVNNELLAHAPFVPVEGCVAYTDDKGSFMLDTLPPGARYTLHADAPNAMPAMLGPMSWEHPAEEKMFRFKITFADAWLRLTLTNTAGAFLTNAVVTIMMRATGEEIIMPYRVLSNQCLVLGPLPAIKADYLRITTPACVNFGDYLYLAEGATSDVGVALRPAPVRYLLISDYDTQRPLTSARFNVPSGLAIDSNGIARIMLHKSFTVEVAAPGYATDYRYMTEGTAPTSTLALARPFDMDVYVYNADGTPATSGEVELGCQTASNTYYVKWTGVLDPSRNINFRNHPHYSSNIALYARTVRYMPLAMTCVTNVQPFGHYVAVLTNPPLGKLAMLVATAGTKQPEQVSCCVTSLLTRTPQTYKLECIRRSDTNSTWCTEDIPTGVYCFTMQYANADVQTDILIQTGMTTLTMYAPGYVPNYIAPPPPMLAKTYNLAVHVYNADGTPATAGQVEVAAESSVNNRSRIRSVECAIAANGSAVYRKLPLDASNILVQVRTVNFVLLASTVVRNVQADTDRIVCITNPPLCQATITIQYPPSNQVCWLECEFSSTTIDHLQRCAPRRTLQTSTASVWRVESIPTGMYVLIAQFSSGARVQTNITLTLATRAIQFAPPVKATVSLRIAPRIPNMSVTNQIVTVLVDNENVAHDVHEARFINGVFECTGLDPDARYEVYVGLTVTSLFLKGVAPCNQTLGIDLPPLYTLRGSVECPERPDARMVVMCANYSRDFHTGSFALALIPPGTYHFTLGIAGHSATTFPVTISAGDVDIGTLRLTATGMAVVAGRIIGRRVSGGKVSFNNGIDYSHETVDIADNGTFITEPMTRGSRAALAADFSDGRWTNIAKVFLTNDVIDIGDVQVE